MQHVHTAQAKQLTLPQCSAKAVTDVNSNEAVKLGQVDLALLNILAAFVILDCWMPEHLDAS